MKVLKIIKFKAKDRVKNSESRTKTWGTSTLKKVVEEDLEENGIKSTHTKE